MLTLSAKVERKSYSFRKKNCHCRLRVSLRRCKSYLMENYIKLASLTYQLLQYRTPSYLVSNLHKHNPVRDLRSANFELVHQPHSVTTVIGSRAFHVAGPTIMSGNSSTFRHKDGEYACVWKNSLIVNFCTLL